MPASPHLGSRTHPFTLAAALAITLGTIAGCAAPAATTSQAPAAPAVLIAGAEVQLRIEAERQDSLQVRFDVQWVGPTTDGLVPDVNLMPTITTMVWDYGDGTVEDNPARQGSRTVGDEAGYYHTYAVPGSYPVQLTVQTSDDRTWTDHLELPVGPLVADARFHSLSSSYTRYGAPWVGDVSGDFGLFRYLEAAPDQDSAAYLSATNAQDVDVHAELSADDGVRADVVVRHTDAGDYRLRLTPASDTTYTAALVKTLGGAQTVLATAADLPRMADIYTVYNVRFAATTAGSATTLRAKAWIDATSTDDAAGIQPTEPSSWLLTATDTQAELASGGQLGLADRWISADPPTTNGIFSVALSGPPGMMPLELNAVDTSGPPSPAPSDQIAPTPAANVIAAQTPAAQAGASCAPYGGVWVVDDDPVTVGNDCDPQLGGLSPSDQSQAHLKLNTPARDIQATIDFAYAVRPDGGATHFNFELRRTTAGAYWAKVAYQPDGRLAISLVNRLGSTETYLASAFAPDTAAPGQWLTLRAAAITSGTTTVLAARVWPQGAAEPTTWQVSASDAQPKLQGGGDIGVSAYLSRAAILPDGVRQVVRFNNLLVVQAAGADASGNAAPEPAPALAPAAGGAASAAAAEVVRLVNQERVAAGCPALRVDNRLTKSAQLHSEDMAANNFFEHNSLDGRKPWDRMIAQGFFGVAYGENIAKGSGSATKIVTAWMGSPGHRENILNCSFNVTGVAVAQGYWTQDFGATN